MHSAPLPTQDMRRVATNFIRIFGWRGAWHFARAVVQLLSTRATEKNLDDGAALRKIDEDFRAALEHIDAVADLAECRAETPSHAGNVIVLPVQRKGGAS